MKKSLFLAILFAITFRSSALGQAETNAFVVLSATTRSQVEAAINSIESKGGVVRHVFEPEVLLCYIPSAGDKYISQSAYVSNIFRGTVSAELFTAKSSRYAAAAFNGLHTENSPSSVELLSSCSSIITVDTTLPSFHKTSIGTPTS